MAVEEEGFGFVKAVRVFQTDPESVSYGDDGGGDDFLLSVQAEKGVCFLISFFTVEYVEVARGGVGWDCVDLLSRTRAVRARLWL